jgi:branched-chain amino acid transport system substrate-binding protein
MLATAMVAAAGIAPARASEPLRIGVIMPFSGPFANYGRQAELGMRAYLEEHGNTVAGRKIELIRKDTTGPAPDLARRLTQETAVRDKVDIIAGYAFTPNALAAAPVLTQAKKPAMILNAATSGIPSKSPYFARMSFTVPQLAHTMGTWAAENGIKTAYVAVVDFGPGHDAERSFTAGFTAKGGRVTGSVRTPLRLPDFGPFLQRIRDEKPDAIYLFLPTGDQAMAFVKTYHEMGLAAAGIKLLTHDITESGDLSPLGAAVNGIITAQFYDESSDRAANKKFLEAFRKVAGPNDTASMLTVTGYDTIAAIVYAVGQQKGEVDPDKTIALIRGLKLDSPRGEIRIERDGEIRQSVYVRRAQASGSKVDMTLLKTIPLVGDPGQ